MRSKPLAILSAALLSSLGGLAGCNNEAAELLKTCEGGNVEACYRDGMKQSDVARPRYNEARKSFSAACLKEHHPQSCNQLAILVRDAKGGPKDVHRAAELFEIACKPNPDNEAAGPQVPSACVDLAFALYDGDGIREDPERAVELLGTACRSEPKSHRACTWLAKAYVEGKGVQKKDVKQGEELYLESCAAQHAEACVEAGKLAAETKRRDDIARAAGLFEQACTVDARQGCYELAVLHKEGKWPDASDLSASEYFQKTCGIDPTRGCFEAAALMESGKVDAREGEIEYLYNLACEHGHTEACTKRQVDLDDRDRDDKKKRK